MTIELELPYPPSVNTYWAVRKYRGRVAVGKSAKAIAWHASASAAILEAGRPTVGLAAVKVEIVAHPPRRSCDVDNCLKAILDALEAAGVVENDNQVAEITVRRGAVERSPGRVLVTIERMEG